MTKEFFERGKQIAKWADANMTKDTALKMVIEAMEDLCEAFMLGADWRGVGVYDNTVDAIQACKEALEQPSWQGNKEFVGLSDDEILSIDGLDCVDENHLINFARAIEQALKEKNNG